MKHYYNTNAERGDVLESSDHNASRQEDVVLQYFKSSCQRYIARFQIEADLGLTTQSASRALRNLVISGRLEKTPIMVTGSYGKKVYTWKLPSEQLDLWGGER